MADSGGNGATAGFKFSIMHYPDDPIPELLDVARVVDELDYYAFYLTDSSFRKDLWVILGALAEVTKRVRIGPNAVRLLLRDPVLVAQSLATLDELSQG